MTKPCEMPCPKCGGVDVIRTWYWPGRWMRIPNDDRCPIRRGPQANEGIRHHCRVCHYEWDTDTLNEQKENDQC